MGLWRVFSIIGGMSLLLSSVWMGGHAPAPTACEAVIVYRSSDGAIYSLWDYQRRIELAPPGPYEWAIDETGWIRLQGVPGGPFYRATLTEPMAVWLINPDIPFQKAEQRWVGWSADGNWGYFIANELPWGSGYLYRVDRMGRHYERLLETAQALDVVLKLPQEVGIIVGTEVAGDGYWSWMTLYYLDPQAGTVRELEHFPLNATARYYEVEVLGVTPDGNMMLIYERGWDDADIREAHLLDLAGTITPLTVQEPHVQHQVEYAYTYDWFPPPYTRFQTQDGSNQTYLITASKLLVTELRPFEPSWQPTSTTLLYLARRPLWDSGEREFRLYDKSTGAVYPYLMHQDSYLWQLGVGMGGDSYWDYYLSKRNAFETYHTWLNMPITESGYTLYDAPLPRTYSPCGDTYVTKNGNVWNIPNTIGTVWSTADDEPITSFLQFSGDPITYVRLHGLEWHWPYLLAGAGGLLLVGVRWRRPKP